MSGYYTRFLGLYPLAGQGRSGSEQAADDLMDEGGRLAEAAAAYEAMSARNEETVVRHAVCLAWTDRAGEAIAMLQAAGFVSAPARAVFAEAWFVWAGGWKNPDRDERREKGWDVLLPLLDEDTPPWLAFATLDTYRYTGRRVEWETITAWMAKAMQLYPDDERFCLAFDHSLPRVEPEERIKPLLEAWRRQPSARMACRLAEVYNELGDHQSAAAYLALAEEMETEHSADAATIAALRIAHIEQLIRQSDGHGALALASDIGSVGHDKLAGPRARLAAACVTGDDTLIASHGREFVSALESGGDIDGYGVLWDEVVVIEGPDWTGREDCQDTPDLSAHRAALVACNDHGVRSWMRYLFAIRDQREQSPDDDETAVDWASIADVLGDAAFRVDVPQIVLFDTSVRLRLKGEKWRELGQRWIGAKVAAEQSGRADLSPAIDDVLLADLKRTATFLRGVRDGLEAGAPAPFAFDAIHGGLGQVRVETSVNVQMADIMRVIGQSDLRGRAQFALGYALHGTRETPEALAAYGRVLDGEPGDTSAIFNSLLLCKSPAQAETARRMAGLVDGLDPELVTDARRQQLADALDRATKACMPAEVPGSPLSLMLADFPRLRHDAPALDTVSLRGIVALTALLRSAPADGDALVLRPLTQGTTLFSPTPALRQLLFAALGTALVMVGESTPAEAVVARPDGWGCHLPQLWWRLSPVAFDVIADARSFRPVSSWPASWRRQVLDLAREIAVDECVQYVDFLCEDRNWPAPAAKDKLQDLAREMIDRYSVSRAYYLFYLGAMAAADNKARLGLTGQHASNTLVVKAAARLESAKSGRYGESITAFNRAHAHPRSALSVALWSDLLDLADAGFDRPVADALGLSPVEG